MMKNHESIEKPITKSTESVKKTNMNRFFKYFWGTIIIFLCISVIVIILGALNSSDESLTKAANQRAYDSLPESLTNKLPQAFRNTSATLFKAPFSQEFQKNVSRAVDQAFKPVYANIPRFADAHYSVIGEYVEMGSAATGELTNHIQDQLFSDLDVRLKGVTQQVAIMIPDDFQKRISEATKKTTSQLQIPPDQEKAFQQVLSNELTKYVTTFRTSTVLGGGVLGAVGAASAVKLLAATMARKLLLKLGAKYAAKLAIKVAGSGTSAAAGAAAGAAIGSVIPGAGTVAGAAIGGIGAAILGWFTVDAVFVSVDEWLNRDDFEKDLRNSITEQKIKVKNDIMKKANAIKKQLGLWGKETLGKTPASLKQSF